MRIRYSIFYLLVLCYACNTHIKRADTLAEKIRYRKLLDSAVRMSSTLLGENYVGRIDTSIYYKIQKEVDDPDLGILFRVHYMVEMGSPYDDIRLCYIKSNKGEFIFPVNLDAILYPALAESWWSDKQKAQYSYFVNYTSGFVENPTQMNQERFMHLLADTMLHLKPITISDTSLIRGIMTAEQKSDSTELTYVNDTLRVKHAKELDQYSSVLRLNVNKIVLELKQQTRGVFYYTKKDMPFELIRYNIDSSNRLHADFINGVYHMRVVF